MRAKTSSWLSMLPAARQEAVEEIQDEIQDQTGAEAQDAAERQDSKPALITRVVSFYHCTTGIFHPRHVMCTDLETITLNTPPDHIPIEGDHFDPLTQRVDVETGRIVDQLPPPPSPDHEWNAASRRWQLKPEVLARQLAQRNALARIKQLENKAQRALREHVLNKPGATERLTSIDQEIAQLRTILTQLAD